MLKSFKYRIYPTDAQKELFDKHFNGCRLIYNLALETKHYAYYSHGVTLSDFDLIKQLVVLKRGFYWLCELDSQSLRQPIFNLGKAYIGFFRGNGYYPKFKRKFSRKSFTSPDGSRIKILNGKLYQPKFRCGIKINVHQPLKGVIKNSTISKCASGRYFVSFLCDTKDIAPHKKQIKSSTTVGIDLGVKDIIVTSDGVKTKNPKHFKNLLSRLRYLNSMQSKRVFNSANFIKAKLKLASCHEKISNQRKDFLQKLSTELINNHDTLCFESLSVKNLMKNKKLSQSIQGCAWGMFVDMCKYKAEWYGKNILQIPTFHPSTKICSECEGINKKLTLSDREWVCDNCGILHDRDINAALNIKKFSLKGGGLRRVKPDELPEVFGAMKQEVYGKM